MGWLWALLNDLAYWGLDRQTDLAQVPQLPGCRGRAHTQIAPLEGMGSCLFTVWKNQGINQCRSVSESNTSLSRILCRWTSTETLKVLSNFLFYRGESWIPPGIHDTVQTRLSFEPRFIEVYLVLTLSRPFSTSMGDLWDLWGSSWQLAEAGSWGEGREMVGCQISPHLSFSHPYNGSKFPLWRGNETMHWSAGSRETPSCM